MLATLPPSLPVAVSESKYGTLISFTPDPEIDIGGVGAVNIEIERMFGHRKDEKIVERGNCKLWPILDNQFLLRCSYDHSFQHPHSITSKLTVFSGYSCSQQSRRCSPTNVCSDVPEPIPLSRSAPILPWTRLLRVTTTERLD